MGASYLYYSGLFTTKSVRWFSEREVGAYSTCNGADVDATWHIPRNGNGGLSRGGWGDQYHHATHGLLPIDPDFLPALAE